MNTTFLNQNGMPSGMADLHDCPHAIYVQGTLPRGKPVVTVVGTRRASDNALWVAERLSFELARSGVVVLSGLAYGVDSAAHQGALDAGGVTCAVLGCGFDHLTRRQREFSARICSRGALVSEYAPEQPAQKNYFRMRNRLMAAWAWAVVIVECPLKSGALITARHALDLGRTVFAVPGDVRRAAAEGSNRLIRDGALVALEADDVLAGLGLSAGAHESKGIPQGLDRIETLIWKQLRRSGQCEPDLLVDCLRLPVAQTLQALAGLELRGVVERSAAGYSLRARPG